jgi:hypothetical protein
MVHLTLRWRMSVVRFLLPLRIMRRHEVIPGIDWLVMITCLHLVTLPVEGWSLLVLLERLALWNWVLYPRAWLAVALRRSFTGPLLVPWIVVALNLLLLLQWKRAASGSLPPGEHVRIA